jgi:hypothetical protein
VEAVNMKAMRLSEFGNLSRLVYAQSGIRLEAQKLDLLQARLRKRMKALSLVSFMDYYQYVDEQNRVFPGGKAFHPPGPKVPSRPFKRSRRPDG